MSDILPTTMAGKLSLGVLIVILILIVVFLARSFAQMDKLDKEDKESDTVLNKSISDYQVKHDQSIKDVQGATDKTFDSQMNYIKTLFGFKNGRQADDGYLSEWSACSAPCGGGVQIRSYYPAINKGVEHKDKNILVQYCNAQACPPPPTTTTVPTTAAPTTTTPTTTTPTTTTVPTTAAPTTTTPTTTTPTTAPANISTFSNYNDWLTSKLHRK